MTRYAKLADGRVLAFPDDTPDEVVVRVAKEQTLAAPKEGPGFLGTLGDIGAGLVRGTGNLIGALGSEAVLELPQIGRSLAKIDPIIGTLSALESVFASDAFKAKQQAAAAAAAAADKEWAQTVAPVTGAIQGAGKAVANLAPERVTPDWEHSQGFFGGLGSIVATAAESAPTTLAALATTIATKNPAAGMAVMGTLGGLQTYSGIRQQQKREGIDDVDRALLGTAASTALDVFTGSGGAISKIGRATAKEALEQGMRHIVKEAVKTGGSEGLTEMAQNLIEQVAGGADPTTKQNMLQTVEAGLVGALMGTPVGFASAKINAARTEAARAAPALDTVDILKDSPGGGQAPEALDILTVPDKKGAVVVRDAGGNIQTVSIKDIEGMRAPPAEGAEHEPLHEALTRKAQERKEAYEFTKATQDALRDPENQDAIDIIAKRYVTMYGLGQEEAVKYAKANIAKARAPQAGTTATEEPGMPEDLQPFAPPEAYADEMGQAAAPAAPPPAAPPLTISPAEKAATILEDTSGKALRQYADANGIDEEEAISRLESAAEEETGPTGMRYMRGRTPRTSADAGFFGDELPKQEKSRLDKREELEQRKLELTPEERVAQQEQVGAEAEQRIAEAQQRNKEIEQQRISKVQNDIWAANKANKPYEVRYVPNSPRPYQVVGPEEADGSRELFVAEDNLTDFENAAGDLVPFTSRPLSAQAVEGGREVPNTPYTQLNQDLVDEINAARAANKITDSEKAALFQQIVASSNRGGAKKIIEGGEKAYLAAMNDLRNADSDAAKSAAELDAANIAGDLRRVVNNVVGNPVRARLKTLTEAREDEQAGAKQRVGNAKVQEALGRAEGEDVVPEQREQREAGIDLAEAKPTKYMRGEKEAGGPPKVVSVEEAQKAVDAASAPWKGQLNISVVNSIADLPIDLRRAMEKDGAQDALGFVAPDGTIYIIADNALSVQDVRAALFHEALGHIGLEKLFRSTLDTALVGMYNNNAKLKADVDAWMAENPDAYKRDKNTLARAIEEVLAGRSEGGRLEVSFFRKIATIIRNFARRMGIKVALTDGDVAAILSMAHDQVVRGKQESTVVKGLRYMTAMRPKTPEQKINRGVQKAQLSSGATFFEGLDEASQGWIESSKENAGARLEALSATALPKKLLTTTTSSILEAIKRMNPPVGDIIAKLDDTEQYMRGMRQSMKKALSRRTKEFEKFVNKYKQDVISGMMTIARVNRVDVTSANSLDELLKNDKTAKLYRGYLTDPSMSPAQKRAYAGHLKNREDDIRAAWAAWEKLGKQPGGQELYKQVRQFYKDMYTALRAEQDENIRAMGLDDAATNRLIAAARGEDSQEDLTDENDRFPGIPQKLFPDEYFPFRRFGNFALVVNAGGGRERERYHFESAYERNRWQAKRAHQLGLKKGTDEYNAAFKQLNSLEEMRNSMAGDSAMLGKMFKIINESTLMTNFDATQFATQDQANSAAKEKLKDQLYQTYLMTLPERSLRKQFIHAEKITGNSADALRIFKNAATQYSSQLPKLAYGREAQRLIETAYDTIDKTKRDPAEMAKLRTLVDAYVGRYRETVDPTNGPGKIESMTSTYAFFNMLTSAYTAAAQLISVPLQAMPRMSARYGYGQTAKVMGNFMRVWDMAKMFVDVDPATGEKYFTAPSLGNTPVIQNNPLRRRFWDELNNKRDLFSQHYSDMRLRDRRTTVYGTEGVMSKLGTGYEQTVQVAGALMSSADQLSREMVGMAFAELHYNKLRKEGVPPEEAFESAVQAAIKNTDDTLGRYTELDKMTALRGGVIRRFIGFLRNYAVQRTKYYFTQLDAITRGSPYQTRRQAFHELMGTVLLGAMAGGVKTIFGYSTACFVIDTVMKSLMSDEEKDRWRREDPKAAFDSDYWLRNVWIPYHFGGAGSMTSKIAKHGALAEMTGADLGPRISQNNLWFREIREGETPSGTLANIFADNFSAKYSQVSQLGDALDDFAAGNMSRGFSKALPAAVRGWVTANRLATEGEVQPSTGRTVMGPEEFTTGDLINQVLGAAPLKLAEVREENRKIIGWQKGMNNERTKLLVETRKMLLAPHTDQDIIEARNKIIAFNSKVPTVPGTNYGDPAYIIEPKDIMQSIETSTKKAEKSIRGVEMSDAQRAYLLQ